MKPNLCWTNNYKSNQDIKRWLPLFKSWLPLLEYVFTFGPSCPSIPPNAACITYMWLLGLSLCFRRGLSTTMSRLLPKFFVSAGSWWVRTTRRCHELRIKRNDPMYQQECQLWIIQPHAAHLGRVRLTQTSDDIFQKPWKNKKEGNTHINTFGLISPTWCHWKFHFIRFASFCHLNKLYTSWKLQTSVLDIPWVDSLEFCLRRTPELANLFETPWIVGSV